MKKLICERTNMHITVRTGNIIFCGHCFEFTSPIFCYAYMEVELVSEGKTRKNMSVCSFLQQNGGKDG